MVKLTGAARLDGKLQEHDETVAELLNEAGAAGRRLTQNELRTMEELGAERNKIVAAKERASKSNLQSTLGELVTMDTSGTILRKAEIDELAKGTSKASSTAGRLAD